MRDIIVVRKTQKVHTIKRNSQSGLAALKPMLATLGILSLLLFVVAPVSATDAPPSPYGTTVLSTGDSVDICHTGNGKNFASNSPSISSHGGLNLQGHEGHSFDIIPSFWYLDSGDNQNHFYPGLNWTADNAVIW